MVWYAAVGDNRLLKLNVNVSDQEITVIQFVNELIQLRDGHLALSNGLIMSRCEVKQVLDFVCVA